MVVLSEKEIRGVKMRLIYAAYGGELVLIKFLTALQAQNFKYEFQWLVSTFCEDSPKMVKLYVVLYCAVSTAEVP